MKYKVLKCVFFFTVGRGLFYKYHHTSHPQQVWSSLQATLSLDHVGLALNITPQKTENKTNTFNGCYILIVHIVAFYKRVNKVFK